MTGAFLMLKGGRDMFHHYITHYGEVNKDGSIDSIVESWFQINIFKWCFCFSKKRLNFGAVWQD